MTIALSALVALTFLIIVGGLLTGSLIVRHDDNDLVAIARGIALAAVVIAVGLIGAFAG